MILIYKLRSAESGSLNGNGKQVKVVTSIIYRVPAGTGKQFLPIIFELEN